MTAARERRRHDEREEVDPFDQLDVPATVVCALCGDAECPGCANEPSRSGVVPIVAWERPGAPLFARLWGTARATTFDAERFFESLPDGPVAPALRFALGCELIAATAMVLGAVPIAALAAPSWLRHLALERTSIVVRLAVVGVPSLALLLVAAHAAHGFALHHGARHAASRGPSRALRFGLYAAGWDLVVGPVGAIVVALREGGRQALRVATIAIGLPTRSARAFLRGAYKLEGAAAEPALRASYVAAAVATLVGSVAVIAAAIAVALL